MDDLKQCPFCGCGAKFVQRSALSYHVACQNNNCGASTAEVEIPNTWDAKKKGMTFMEAIEKLSIELWNARTHG